MPGERIGMFDLERPDVGSMVQRPSGSCVGEVTQVGYRRDRPTYRLAARGGYLAVISLAGETGGSKISPNIVSCAGSCDGRDAPSGGTEPSNYCLQFRSSEAPRTNKRPRNGTKPLDAALESTRDLRYPGRPRSRPTAISSARQDRRPRPRITFRVQT